MRGRGRGVWLGVGGAVVGAVLVMGAVPGGRGLMVKGAAVLKGAGVGGRVAAVGMVVAGVPMGVPTLWLAGLVGYVFGAAVGVPVALGAVWIGAVTAFALARWLLRDVVKKVIARRRRWRAVVDAVGDGGVRLVVLLRLAGPHNLLNLVLAGSPLTWRQFAAGTFVGSLPSVTLAALGGAVARDAGTLWRARGEIGAAWTALVVAGGVALVLAVVLMVRATRRALANAGMARAADRPAASPYTDDVSPREAPLIRHTDEMTWEASPSATVMRKRLELVGPAEAGRVTSVVRYLPDSSFHAHPHPDGEEILVLEGVFTDQTGDHPAGSYLLNPDGFEHAPSSRGGCVLFVKLRQYPGAGRETVRIHSAAAEWSPHPSIAGVEMLELYRRERRPEEMHLVRIGAGADVPRQEFPGGEEIFVIDGDFADEHGEYRAGSWVRYPPGSGHTPRSERGCTLYVKKNHLGR